MTGEKKAGKIFLLPGKIKDGRCTTCGANVAYIVEAFEVGEINDVNHCPECNTQLIDVVASVWRCKNCGEKIVDPKRQKNCTNCGTEIILPPEENNQQEEI